MDPEQPRPDLQLQQRLRFETLLADLSSRFVNVSPDQLDSEIGDAMRRVCEHLHLDLSSLWLSSAADPHTLMLSHVYRSLAGPPIPETMNAATYFPWSQRRFQNGRIVPVSSMTELPPEAARDRDTWERFGVKTSLGIPLSAGGERLIGVLSFNTMREERDWPDAIVQRLQLVAQVFANALVRRQSEQQLRQSYAEVERLKAQLELENIYLRREHQLLHGSGRVVGESPAIMQVLALVEQVAPTTSTVLIEGETGTGKELIAQRIHELSPRNRRPMVKVNCAALPSTLVESELFGREKGAYTGAVSREPGRFEVADGSTIFLDEVAELPLELQSKLLRVLEEGRFERVGSSRTMKTDVRVIAATNRDLQAEVEAGRFRRDLYFRLAVFPIRVPPLRERRGDVPLLVWSAVEEFSRAMAKSIETIRRENMEELQRYDWPGNVRELRNLVERAMILSSGPTLAIDLPGGASAGSGGLMSLDEAQRLHIARALEASGGRIRGPGGAAELLGMKPTTLRSRMQRLGIDPKNLRDD